MLILFNGPPGSGKDTIGSRLTVPNSKIYKFATPLKKCVATLFNLNEDEYDYYLESNEKNKIQSRFFNQTPRSCLISVAENLKVWGGQDLFGKLLNIETENVIITDCGFVQEIESLLPLFKKVLLVRLHRKGYTFSNDSRGYIDYPIPTLDVENETIDDAVNMIQSYIKNDL